VAQSEPVSWEVRLLLLLLPLSLLPLLPPPLLLPRPGRADAAAAAAAASAAAQPLENGAVAAIHSPPTYPPTHTRRVRVCLGLSVCVCVCVSVGVRGSSVELFSSYGSPSRLEGSTKRAGACACVRVVRGCVSAKSFVCLCGCVSV
jgi:hypothetical protein